jgi:hypothetical protein
MKFLPIFAILAVVLLLVQSSKLKRTETSTSTETTKKVLTEAELPAPVVAAMKKVGKSIAASLCDQILPTLS